MEQISLFNSDTAVVNNLGLGRALIQADIYARYLLSKKVSAGVRYFLSDEPACSLFSKNLQEFTKQLGLLPALGISTAVFDTPDKWPRSRIVLYPKEHGLSPFALCKLDLNSDNTNRFRKVIEYSPLQFGNTPLTIKWLLEKGFSIYQIRNTLGSVLLSEESVPIENLTSIKKLGEMSYQQSLRITKISPHPESTEKSAIGAYTRQLKEISEALDAGDISASLDRVWRLFLYEHDNSSFSSRYESVFETANNWHQCYRYIVAAEELSDALFPVIDLQTIDDELVELPIQVDGKIRAKLEVTRSTFNDEERLIEQALSLPNVIQYTKDTDIQSTHVVPFKILYIVTTR